jgi:hypothetical protein
MNCQTYQLAGLLEGTMIVRVELLDISTFTKI